MTNCTMTTVIAITYTCLAKQVTTLHYTTASVSKCGGASVEVQVWRCNVASATPATPVRKGRISIGCLGQSEALLPSIVLAATLRSFTVDSEQVLGRISPVKRLQPRRYLWRGSALIYAGFLYAVSVDVFTLCHTAQHKAITITYEY